VAKRIESRLADEICPLFHPRMGLGSDNKVATFTECFDLHIECVDRPRSVRRGFGNDMYTFHTTFFELHESFPSEPDSWTSGRIYSRDGVSVKQFRKACITV
jgi:hypothetical protein